MPRNKLSDLNNHLFEQLERLQDDDMSNEDLEREVKRSKAISQIASQIVGNSKVVLQAAKMKAQGIVNPPKTLIDEKTD